MRSLLLAAALAAAPALVAAQAAPAAAPAPAAPTFAADSAAVVGLVTRLFDGMRTRDTAAIRAAFLPGAGLTSSAERQGQPTVTHDSIPGWIASVGSAPPGLVLDERLRNPRVLVADGLAVVWVEYDFYAGERFSHCGVDAFTLARTADGWRIAHVADTRRRTGCPGQ